MTAMGAGLSSDLTSGCGNDKSFSGSLSAVTQKPVEWNESIASDYWISPPDGDVSQAAITLLKEENQMLRRNLKLAEDEVSIICPFSSYVKSRLLMQSHISPRDSSQACETRPPILWQNLGVRRNGWRK